MFITGGTIDKIYNQSNGLLEFGETHFPKMLTRARTEVVINLEKLMLLDSSYMSDEDRSLIVDNCIKCKEDRIVITHGTDTMCDTARLLGKNIKHKTIVLFGAMVPYKIDNSDALFNLGCAIASVQLLEKGVYVAMNGRVLPFDSVQKNIKLGIFQTLDQ